MTEKWPEVSRSLRRAKASAERRLTEIEHERRETKASVRSLDAALKALGKNEDQAEGAQRKTAITTTEVVEIATQILRAQSGLSMAQLTKRVAAKLTADGRSRSGLKLRLAQALKDRRFRETADGYELAGDGERPSSHTESSPW